MDWYKFKNVLAKEIYSYRNSFSLDILKPSIKKTFLTYIINCPSKDSSQISKKLNEYNLKNNLDFENEILKIQNILNIKASNYIAKDRLLTDEWFEQFLKCKINRNSFIYIKKHSDHLDTFYKKIRNSIAHGTFYIRDNFIILWNLSNQNNITALMHIRISSFIKIANLIS